MGRTARRATATTPAIASTAGHDVSGATTDDAMTRSEEELHVGKTERETGRARLRKYVVEDEVTQTVPVRREEVRIEREPITDANAGSATDGPEISSNEPEGSLARDGSARAPAPATLRACSRSRPTRRGSTASSSIAT